MSEKNEEGNAICKTYSDFLKASKDVIEGVKLPFKVKAAKNQLAGEIIDLEGQIAEGDLEVIKAKSKHPLKLDDILKSINNKELLERKLKQANELMEELFPSK